MASPKASQRLFLYPPMERQDLNQSQLGSFKFTPVDPVTPIDTLTLTAKNMLDQEFSRRQRVTEASASSAGPFQDNGSTLSSGRAPPQLMNSAADTDFFNKHIKPDLEDSRLRLGPAAVRTAVDGGSPAKTFIFTHGQQGAAFDQNHHPPANYINAAHAMSPDFSAATMDPTATTSMPAAHLVNPNLPDPATLSEILCKALESEQLAHNATKAALADHITRRLELEEQLKTNKQTIASMNTTIKNLGAIIKHNAAKLSAEDAASSKQTEYSEDQEEAALRAYYREFRKLKKTADEKEKCTEEEQLHNVDPLQDDTSTKQDAAGLVVAAATTEIVDDAHLYNLDLLQKPDEGNSADSVLRRTLRKHFSIDSSADDGKTPETPSKKRGSLNKLVNISPESVDGDEHVVPPQGQGELIMVNPRLTPTQVRLLTVTDPTVNSNEEVVAKYGWGLASAPAPLKEKSNGVDLTMQHLRKLEALRIGSIAAAKSQQDETYGRLSPTSSVNDDDAQSTTAVVSSTSQPSSKDRILLKIGTNLHGETKWKITKDNPIYADYPEKEESVVRFSGSDFCTTSRFFQHPVRYLPEDAASDVDAYRTVMIDGISDGSTVMEVLSVVKGGSLESIQLLPPIGTAMPTMTARVVFVYERSAHNMIKHQEAKQGEDARANRFKINGVAVRCWMPTDPTYPRNYDVGAAISYSDASRIVAIGHVDEDTYDALPYKIGPARDNVIEYVWTVEGHVEIEFTDIASAIKAKYLLEISEGLWGGDRIQYLPDYTCVPYVNGEAMGN